MNLRKVIPFAVLAAVAASPAHADPITAAVTAVSGIFAAVSSTAVGSFLLRTAASFGLSALASKISSKQGQQQQRGISTSTTTAGGTQPQTVILGRYATAGHHECPPMTHGLSGSDQVKYMTYVISLSDYRISDIAWVIVDGNSSRYTTQRADGDGYYGKTDNGGKHMDRAWLRWHDGTQTAADEMLVETYSGYERPWTEDHILTGVAYAAMTFKWDSGFTQFPEVLFEIEGAPLYDPRLDVSVGGSGTHVWNDVSTHAFTENPVVMIYNVLRGLRLADGTIYGLGVDAEDLPLDRWAAAMNVCDEQAGSGGGLRREKRYKAGIEFSIETEPLAVIEDLLKSCGGRVAECGGFWNVSVGPAPFARAHIDDESLIVSNPRERAPFRGLRDTYNSIHASYINKHGNWTALDAPAFYKDEWIEEDDGRRLVAELNLPTVTQSGQAQRLMQELLTDNRMMITHALTLPPTALGLLPLDTLTWTSAENGYENKLFEIQGKVIDPATLNVKVALRERSPEEYIYLYYQGTGSDELPAYPEGIDDGSPDPEDNPTDGDYTDPITGDPLVPVRPGASLGDVIALHDGAVSRSTDGGAEWLRLPATFGPARDISAVAGQGFLVRTSGSEIVYSSALRRWNILDLEGFNTEALTVTNGDFEAGDLSGWAVNGGSPYVLDTAQPPQQGGAWYVCGDTEYQISNQLSLPATAGRKLNVSARVLANRGVFAELEVSDNPGGGAVYEFGSMTLQPDQTEVSGKGPQRNSGDISSWRLSGATSGVTHIEFFNASVYSSYSDPEMVETFTLKLRDGAGKIWSGNKVATQFGPGNGTRESAAAMLQLVEWSNKSTKVDVAIALTNSQSPGETVSVVIPAGFQLPHNYIDYRQLSGTAWTCRLDAAHFHGTNTYFYPASVLIDEVRSAETVSIEGAGHWTDIALTVDADMFSPTYVILRAKGDGVYFDDVRAELVSPGDMTVHCISRDLVNRRHLAATGAGIHEVIGGKATQLCDTPFAPKYLSVNGSILVIASGADIAFSDDNGINWTEHTATAPVFDLHARPGAIAALLDGSIVSVSVSALSQLSSLGAAHRLSFDARGRRWLAVSAMGAVQSSPDLAVWSQEPDMPVSSTAAERSVLPLDIGRMLGRADASKDLFWKDQADAGWSVAPSLTSQIRDMTEIK